MKNVIIAIISSIHQKLSVILDPLFEQIFLDTHLEKCSSFMGFDIQYFAHMDPKDVKIHGLLSVATLISVIYQAFGLSCLIELMLVNAYFNTIVFMFFGVIFFNMYRLLYATGGSPVYTEEYTEWKHPKMILIFFIMIAIISGLSLSTYEALYIFGWEIEKVSTETTVVFEISEHFFYSTIVGVFAVIVAIVPIVYRLYHVKAFQEYYRHDYETNRSIVLQDWTNCQTEMEVVLHPYQRYRHIKFPIFADPPFNKKQLIFGVLSPHNDVATPKDKKSG